MTYKDIINDKEIMHYYEIIDSNNYYYMSHGLKHINNAINLCKKFSKLLNLNSNDERLLLISASLHDIGAYNGRENHANKSAMFAKEYLRDKLSEEDLETVFRIIDRHGRESIRETILEDLMFLADKFDFTKDRLEDNYEEKYGFKSVLDKLLDISFTIEDNTLIIKFITNGLTLEELIKEKQKYDMGIELNSKLLGRLLNMKYKVLFDNKVIFHD